MLDRRVPVHTVLALTPTRRQFIAATGAAVLSGCAADTRFLEPPAKVARSASVAGVPLIAQNQYYCGPASLAMVLQWSGKNVTQEELAAQSFTPGARGTFKSDMVGTARRQGMLAVKAGTLEALLTEVDAGHPVIVFQNIGLSWAPAWHYGVVVAYDLNTQTITLHSGERDLWRMPLAGFLDSWELDETWALVVLPPDRLPAALPELDTLRAAAALERLGLLVEAESAYRTGAKRWQTNWLWPFGLGNTLYAAGDVAGAEAAFKAALARDPTAEAAKANLATLRAERAT